MAGRVISSGYIPPVSSNSARRNKLSELYGAVINTKRGKGKKDRILTCQNGPQLLASARQVQQQPC